MWTQVSAERDIGYCHRVSGPIVETTAGEVEGARVEGVRRWLGIPYAQAERFAAPEPPAPWQGVRKADAFGPQCPQIFGHKPKNAQYQAPGYDEARCLGINVWAPEGEPERPRPVFFWIHGGAFTLGSADIYDGAALARSGDVVVVSINYRLGALGFVNFEDALDLPQLPSNLGLRDMIAALEWVRDNIAAFGGDPGQVTIAGESAGSMAVSLLMICERAWPLFHGAIMQSGAISLIHDRAKSTGLARRHLEQLGISGSGEAALEQLRGLDVRSLLLAHGQVDKLEAGGIAAAPWFDGDLLPASLPEALEQRHAPVPLIAGATREESRLFELARMDILPLGWPALEAVLEQRLSAEDAERVLAAYPRTKRGRRDLATDLAFAIPTRTFAERHASQGNPTWYYRFDYSHPLFGACHGIDLLMLWPGTSLRATLARGGPQTGKRLALAKRMRGHWASFTRTGEPGSGWPRYELDSRQVYLFDKTDEVAKNPDGDKLEAWHGVVIGPGASSEAPAASRGS
nr:carboxylesterase family protein [Pseudenhygromyxa sp. WMMC2535]